MNLSIKWCLTVLMLFVAVKLSGQVVEGAVSYVSTSQVYVKFQSTQDIIEGDTLYMKIDDNSMSGVLIVVNKSSISCVCNRIGLADIQVGNKVFHHPKPVDVIVPVSDSFPNVTEQAETPSPLIKTIDTIETDKTKSQTRIRGRVSLASYTTIHSEDPEVSQRMRYTLAFKADKIRGTGLSTETYITFSHRNNRWDEIREDVFNGLKIYAMALNYHFSSAHSISFGRKINPKISQLGVNDGLQYEFTHRSITLGILGGSRPDQQNFSLNTGLFQTGAYLVHARKIGQGAIQTTAAFVQQTNKGAIDRRYIYMQHTNSLLPKIYFFGSLEFNLYKKINELKTNEFNLSNTYLSIRYRPVQRFSMSLSYSSRQAIIYYETYKTIVEQLLEQASTQGLNLQADYRPFRGGTLGFRAGYRNNVKDARITRNLHTYLNVAQIPRLKIAASLTATFIATPYQEGSIYSISCYKDFIGGRLSTNLSYRYVNNFYITGEFSQTQHMAEMGLGYRLSRKFFVNLNSEHTFEKNVAAHRIYCSLTQRF
ncbi:MAG: hypothetical protein Q8S18_12350 [Bacteroidales bacterium]|nr:hypothetical protein [Bacteroidales bacterium]